MARRFRLAKSGGACSPGNQPQKAACMCNQILIREFSHA